MNDYYTYAYLREDKTPYYIGKGRGNRAYCNHSRSCPTPKDRTRVLFLKKNLSEFDAYKHEIYMIAVLGRKDLGTGILRNLTPGGEGGREPGFTHTPEACAKMSVAGKGRSKSAEHKRKIGEAQVGKHVSIKTRARMSASAKKKRLSPEHKAKIGLASKGKPWSQARRNAYNKSKEE